VVVFRNVTVPSRKRKFVIIFDLLNMVKLEVSCQSLKFDSGRTRASLLTGLSSSILPSQVHRVGPSCTLTRPGRLTVCSHHKFNLPRHFCVVDSFTFFQADALACLIRLLAVHSSTRFFQYLVVAKNPTQTIKLPGYNYRMSYNKKNISLQF